jgi:hypothetical protein
MSTQGGWEDVEEIGKKSTREEESEERKIYKQIERQYFYFSFV